MPRATALPALPAMLRLSRGLADDRSERGFVDGRRPFVAASQPPALPRDTAAAALRCMPESSWGGGGERWELGVQVPGRMREPPPWPLGGILRQKTPPNRSPWHFFPPRLVWPLDWDAGPLGAGNACRPVPVAPRSERACLWRRLCLPPPSPPTSRRGSSVLETASRIVLDGTAPCGRQRRRASTIGRQSGPARDRWTGIVRQREHGARAHEGIARGHRDMRTVPPHGRALDGGTLPQCGHRRGVRGGTAESIGGVASEPPPVRASARPQATHPVASSTTTTSRARCICRTLTLSGDQSQREA
ncbi:hypothetical protein PCL_06270 [Purpureocillium lilacinum]|uniref:Uncharacterized protein n=1 Tax=Purpureocillium lilacinum TaxID=33203 RepID=A0A2U3EMB2_PURLI|nr:hypothetical protein Purlil1_4086 [Purpureocillium lilacinum]PWI75612.1 hypothetical protein PCL_06270 [Purpureocillium lilacinum]